MAPPALQRVSGCVLMCGRDVRLGGQGIALVDGDGDVLGQVGLVLCLGLVCSLFGNVVVGLADLDLQLILVEGVGGLEDQVLENGLVLLLVLRDVGELGAGVLEERVEQLLAGGQDA